jgi:hypothetical protein
MATRRHPGEADNTVGRYAADRVEHDGGSAGAFYDDIRREFAEVGCMIAGA